MRAQAERWRREGLSIGLVPTMGALHAGHASLLLRARQENDRVVASVFVNPLQFGPGEDFERYPRSPEADLRLLGELGADAAYTPSAAVMYAEDAATRVSVRGLGERLEGQRRPGHFEGVATVVLKLFDAVRPHRAYFGQKDAQQAAVVTLMARDLDTGVEVRVCPIVREADGLALSSRNAYLGHEERRAATVLFRALDAAEALHRRGERDHARLAARMREVICSEPLAELDYAELVDPRSFEPPGPLAVLAVRVGRTRLIDNHLLGDELPAPEGAAARSWPPVPRAS
jgi:pantoate--beta-alanine ligase